MAPRIQTRVHALFEEVKNDPNPRVSRWITSGLYAVSIGYGALVRARGCLQDHGYPPLKRLPVPVVSIGNVTVGGTGKTPITQHIALGLMALGRRPAIISRGYGGLAEKKGGIVGDGTRVWMDAQSSGDEPYLMAWKRNGIPVLVGKDRYASGMTAVKRFGADVLVLDDGFQHQRLWRDVNLLLLDHRRPMGNGYLLPRGELRESAQAMRRADAIIWTHVEGRGKAGWRPGAPWSGIHPVFRTRPVTYLAGVLFPGGQFEKKVPPDQPKGKVLAFAGIAHNGDFFSALERIGHTPVKTLSFPDHHRYGPEDLKDIQGAMAASKAHWAATTLKDYVRIETTAGFPVPLAVYDVKPEFIGGDRSLMRFVQSRI